MAVRIEFRQYFACQQVFLKRCYLRVRVNPCEGIDKRSRPGTGVKESLGRHSGKLEALRYGFNHGLRRVECRQHR